MRKKDYFIPKMYRRLLIPSLFSSLGFAFADMADAFVLGQRIGETGLAAISIVLPVFMLINIFMDGFGIGGSIRFSQLLGEGKREDAVGCFNRIWTVVLFVGIALGLLANLFAPQILSLLGARESDSELYAACESYMRIIALGSPALMLNIVFSNFLRNDDNAGLAAVGFLIGNATDIILNIILVLFLGLGTAGAALSTVTGSVVAICIYLPGILTKKANILKIQIVKQDFKEIGYCFKTGFSTSVQHVFQFVFLIVINNLLMNLSGKDGVAVFDLVYNVSFLIIYLINGAAEAAQPLVSTFCGENNDEDCKTVLRLVKRYGIVICTLVSALLFIFAKNTALAFGISETLAPLAVYAIRIYCIGYAFVVLNIIYEQYYHAKENFRVAFFISLMKRFAVLIPCALVLCRLGIYAVWFMFPVSEFISLTLFYLYRHIRYKDEAQFDKSRILRRTVENQNQDLSNLLTESQAFCEQWNADVQQQYYVTLIIEELCTTIIRNAIKNDPCGKIRITLLAMPDGDFRLNVLDNAVKFNPFSIHSVKDSESKDFDFDEISINLVKKKAKKFMYRQCSGFNSLVVQI